MQTILRRIRQKFYKWTERKLNIPIDSSVPTERLGTPYGGWIIPKNILNADSVCYLVGAGEDVSFDLAVAAAFGCPVHIFDPTPRAVAHVELLKQNLAKSIPTPCATSPGGFYSVYPPHIADLIHMHPIGIWNEDTQLRFFTPANEAYVSHSIVNLQQTENFIEVPVRRLDSMMRELGHQRINLLKIDIEGAEYQVIESIIQTKTAVDILCIEFDESSANHFDGKYLTRIEQALFSLISAGFTVIAKEANCHNYTLLHNRQG